MKCETIRDLLPLYIDGLTSKESNQEIEEHLKTCDACQKFYQDMTGEISNKVPTAPLIEEEIQTVKMIKKMKKRNKRKIIGTIMAAFLIVSLGAIFISSKIYSHVKFKEVELNYGIHENIAYFEMESKPGYEIYVSGSSEENEMTIKILSVRKIGSSKTDKMRLESEIGTKSNPYRWVIEFKDKTIVIENGKLIE